MKEDLYRKEALQHLAVAERLDTAVQVVSPATSLVVLAAAAFVATAMVWAAVGKVPSRVYGDGLLLRQGSIVDVTSMADGQVQHVAVSVGDLVKENDTIATIDQPELRKQRSLLEAKLAELSDKYTQLESLDDEGREIKQAAFTQHRASVSFALTETRKQLAFYEGKLKSDTALLEKGLTTPAAVAETRQKVLDLYDAIHSKQAEGHNIAFDVLEATRTLRERQFDLAMQVSETRRDLEELQKRFETQSVVVAKSAGRVIEVRVTDGDAVTRGRPIATLEVAPNGPGDLVAEVYLPAQDGKRVKAGMPIKLSPSVVKPEEDGYLEGIVDSVSPFPVSEQSMLREVRNQNLVDSLLKDGPVYEAHVRVEPDPSTPSGLRWSNGRGPTVQIASGTPVNGLVTVRTRRPIELVIPAIERIVTDTPAEEPSH
jgi:HlyD family secretion protein